MNILTTRLEDLARVGLTPQRAAHLGATIEAGHATFVDGPGYETAMKALGRTKPAVPPGSDVLARVGPVLWQQLHAWAMSADLSTAGAWLDRFGRSVPCGDCRRHWTEMVRRTPPDLTNRDSLFAWTVERHNEVNLRLGKPVIDVPRANEIWKRAPLARAARSVPSVLDRRRMRHAHVGRAGPAPASRYALGSRRVLILRCTGGLGDVTALSGAIRDLHLAAPGSFRVVIRHWAAHLFKGLPPDETIAEFAEARANPPLASGEFGVNVPISLYGDGNIHLQELHAQQLRRIAGIDFPTTRLGGDLRLTDEEKAWVPPWPLDLPVCILNAGSKQDFTVKQPDPLPLAMLVRRFAGRIRFVQVGGRHHLHPAIEGAIDFRRRPDDPESVWTDFRWTMLAMYRARLVISPVSWPAHLAAALELPAEAPPRRCIVIGGGRENPALTRYPGHDFIDTIGQLPCCEKPCWLMKTRSECLAPVPRAGTPDGVALCMSIAGSPARLNPLIEKVLCESS
jgi:hypothetical protein